MGSGYDDLPEPDTGGGVDPRISLANERTFLAWVRTALGLMAAGVAIAHVLATEESVELTVVGTGLIFFGALISVLSYRRWGRNERRFASRLPLERSPMPGLLTGLMVVIAAAALILAISLGR